MLIARKLKHNIQEQYIALKHTIAQFWFVLLNHQMQPFFSE